MFCWRWFLALHYHNDVAKGWTSTVHRQDKHDFSLIMIEFKLVSTHQDGNQLGSLSILPRVRIEKRGSEKFNGTIIYRTLPDNLPEFKKEDCAVLLQLSFILKSLQ